MHITRSGRCITAKGQRRNAVVIEHGRVAGHDLLHHGTGEAFFRSHGLDIAVQCVHCGGHNGVGTDDIAAHIRIEHKHEFFHILGMIPQIGLRALETHFLSAEEDKFQGTLGRILLVIPQQLHNGHHTGAVVPDTGGKLHAVIVCADGYIFIGEFRAGYGDDHIVGGDGFFLGFGGHLYLFGVQLQHFQCVDHADHQCGKYIGIPGIGTKPPGLQICFIPMVNNGAVHSHKALDAGFV